MQAFIHIQLKAMTKLWAAQQRSGIMGMKYYSRKSQAFKIKECQHNNVAALCLHLFVGRKTKMQESVLFLLFFYCNLPPNIAVVI